MDGKDFAEAARRDLRGVRARIRRLEASRALVAQVSRKLSHSVMLPLNAVCLAPARILETNRVGAA